MDTLQLHFKFETLDKHPEFLPIAAPGENVGNDGRTFYLPKDSNIVTNFATKDRFAPVDINHSSHIKTPQGEPAPSFGKIYALEIRDGVLGALVKWSEQGIEKLDSEEYFYYSPAFIVDRNNNLINLESIGLTNTPNLNVPSLNFKEGIMPESETIKKGGDQAVVDFATMLKDVLSLNTKQSKNSDKEVLDAVQGLQAKLAESEKAALEMHTKQDSLIETIANLELQIFTQKRDSILSKVPAGKREALAKLCTSADQLDSLREVVNAEPEIPGKLEVHTKQEMVDAQAKYQEDVIASAKAKRGVK